jgi:hypothetical protein
MQTLFSVTEPDHEVEPVKPKYQDRSVTIPVELKTLIKPLKLDLWSPSLRETLL